MKKVLKGYLIGFISAVILLNTVVVFAANTTTLYDVLAEGVKIFIDGQKIEPKDANGNKVEPFIYNGTTYLPVRAVAEAIGKEVSFDAATTTVYLGAKPAAGAKGAGTRSNPYRAYDGVVVPYNTYSFYPVRQVKVVCNKVIRGEAGNYLVDKENSFNAKPSANQEWVILDMELSYISSTEGENNELSGTDIIYKDRFFKQDGSKMPIADRAALGDYFDSYDAYDVDLYPGGKSRVVIGLLTEKSVTEILLKIPCEEGKNNNWIKCTSSTNTITSVDEAKKYLGIDEYGNNADSPVQITLKTQLPKTISRYNYSDKKESSANITAFNYTVSGSTVKMSFTGEKTYDIDGPGQSRAVNVGWKLYDSEGYVVGDGTAYSTSICMGEKFKNCEDRIYGLEPGKYTLEIMNVN